MNKLERRAKRRGGKFLSPLLRVIVTAGWLDQIKKRKPRKQTASERSEWKRIEREAGRL